MSQDPLYPSSLESRILLVRHMDGGFGIGSGVWWSFSPSYHSPFHLRSCSKVNGIHFHKSFVLPQGSMLMFFILFIFTRKGSMLMLLPNYKWCRSIHALLLPPNLQLLWLKWLTDPSWAFVYHTECLDHVTWDFEVPCWCQQRKAAWWLIHDFVYCSHHHQLVWCW